MNIDELRGSAFPLPDDRSRVVVPEPVVKRALAELGVSVPRATLDLDTASDLTEPLVLKAWGPGIVHKAAVGAVQLDLSRRDVVSAAAEMQARLAPAGFLVEEQHHGGVELLIGVVVGPFGPVVMLGVGGALTEVVDRTAARLCPLTPAAAHEMIEHFPLPTLLEGVDQDALSAIVLAIAGEHGLAAQLGSLLCELECNPIVADYRGAVALDARLLLHAEAPMIDEPPPPTDFGPLFAPRSIAVAGASTTKITFGNRFLGAYRDVGWTDGLYAVHPTVTEIDGVPATASVVDIPNGVDYLLVAVPADRCAELVRSSAGSARFVHVISGGFTESGSEGAALEADLLRAARESEIRVLGPNCLGVFSPAGRQTFQLGAPTDPGAVGVISQSGGLAGDIVKAGERRGIRFSKLVTVGNAIDVTAAELLEYLVDDSETRVIGMYVEGARDGERLVHALRQNAGKKPVVILPAGTSTQGARAAVSHTGALAGDERVWEAVGASTGTAIVHTLEDLLAVLSFAQRYPDPVGEGTGDVLVVGPGGGASVLASDACDRHGLRLTPVGASVQQQLRDHGYGAGTSMANPLEIPLGPATEADAFDRVLDPVLAAQPYPDLLLHVNVQSYFSYGAGGGPKLLEVVERIAQRIDTSARLALVLRNVECAPPPDQDTLLDAAADACLPLFRNFDEAATAIAALKRFGR